MPCQGPVFGERLVPVSRALCLLVSVTVAFIQISFSYSILFSRLTPLMLHGSPFLVHSGFWLDVSVFRHMHSCVGLEGHWGGADTGGPAAPLSGGCSCPLAEELHTCDCIKTGHVPSTPSPATRKICPCGWHL